MIKCKTQLVKVEKENENKHIRRKNTTLHRADRVPLGRAETVWERLSKVRKSASNEDTLAVTSKSKTTVRTKSAHRMQPTRGGGSVNRGAHSSANQVYSTYNTIGYTSSSTHCINPQSNHSKKPLSLQNYSNKREKLNEKKPSRKVLRPGKTPYDNVVVEEVPYCGLTKNVEEIFTPRSLCNSKSSSDESKNANSNRSGTTSRSAECQTECYTRSHTYPKILVNQHSHSQSVNRVHSHVYAHNESGHPNVATMSSTYSQNPSPRPILRKRYSPSHSPTLSQNYSPTHHQKNRPMYDRTDSAIHSPKYSSTHSHIHSSTHSPIHSPKQSHTQGILESRSRSTTPFSKMGLNLTEAGSKRQLEQGSSNSQNSLDLYQVAPLIPVPTRDSLNSSVLIQNNFESLLQKKQHSMAPDEIKLIKRVVKADERYRQLHQSDEKLFKDILKTQLKDILQQGTIVKSALHKLGDSESECVIPSISQMEKSVDFSEVPDKQQVNVVFKNVPSLEKEIIILRALGEKLEATLKRTTSHRTIHINERRSTATSMGQLQQIKIEHGVLAVEHNATMRVLVMGIRRCTGIVKEFNIVHKTIVELKQESDRHFYLPLGGQRGELKRTSFRKLKQTPDILLRYLKPKNSFVPFNVLEQDPIFFNSFLLNINSSPRLLQGSVNMPDAKKCTLEDDSDVSYQNICLHEGGDSTAPALTSRRNYFEQLSTAASSDVEDDNVSIEDILYSKYDKETSRRLSSHKARVTFDDEINAKENTPPITKQVNNEVETTKHMPKVEPPPTPPAAPKQVRRIRRRSVTPMPLYKYPEPKNSLLKTVLVGSLQISVFLLLIMAITYPDLKC